MGDSMGFQKHLSADEQVVVSLLQSNYSIFTQVLVVFHLTKSDTTEKMSPRDFIVILNCTSYSTISLLKNSAISWTVAPKHCACNGCEYE